jgi:hypothetical protein
MTLLSLSHGMAHSYCVLGSLLIIPSSGGFQICDSEWDPGMVGYDPSTGFAQVQICGSEYL